MNRLAKSIVLFWATTILVASTCFGADLHYCKGEVQSFALLDSAKPCNMHKKKVVEKVPKCCMARKAAKAPSKGFPILKNGKCCYNDQIAFKSDGEQQHADITSSSFQVEKAVPQVAPSTDVSSAILADANTTFRGPPDPFLDSNYQVFFQVFRI